MFDIFTVYIPLQVSSLCTHTWYISSVMAVMKAGSEC